MRVRARLQTANATDPLLIITESAKADLAEIWRFIAPDNVDPPSLALAAAELLSKRVALQAERGRRLLERFAAGVEGVVDTWAKLTFAVPNEAKIDEALQAVASGK